MSDQKPMFSIEDQFGEQLDAQASRDGTVFLTVIGRSQESIPAVSILLTKEDRKALGQYLLDN